MGFLRRLFGLRGGGSRARKHERRLPRSVAEIDRAFRSYTAHKSLTWRRSVEDASWQDPAGHIHRYKAKILPDTIVPGKACVFFVTEARGERLPHDLREKPYEVSKLCQGGRSFTGMIQMADRQRTKQLAHDKAYFEKHDRYPPRHR